MNGSKMCKRLLDVNCLFLTGIYCQSHGCLLAKVRLIVEGRALVDASLSGFYAKNSRRQNLAVSFAPVRRTYFAETFQAAIKKIGGQTIMNSILLAEEFWGQFWGQGIHEQVRKLYGPILA